MTRHVAWAVLAASLIGCVPSVGNAVEGSSAAGPIGGTDIRSAQLPPPGLYAGSVFLFATAHQYVDGSGNVILPDLELTRSRVGPFLFWVPNVQVAGGTIAVAGIVPAGAECGALFATQTKRCVTGVGDPYIELAWSRYFGTPRPSRYQDAYPISEGLTIAFAFGMVIPVGTYNAYDATTQGLSIGNYIWDFAPIVAFTYVSPPIIAEGTEISAKFYWNNYLENPATHYQTGSLVNIDFAISEKVGRFQAGIAGLYAFQVADDKLNGVRVPPDGRRGSVFELGPVIGVDFPEYGAAMKIKGLHTVTTANTVKSGGVALTVVKKLY
jgi:hypothetical protein